MKEFEKITQQLEKRFPGIQVLPSTVFSENIDGGLWLRNTENILYTEKDGNRIFHMSPEGNKRKFYQLDIYCKFENWLDKRGWTATAENFTLIIYPKDI